MAGEDGGGIGAAEAIGEGDVVSLRDVFVRLVETRWAVVAIVGIAGDEVDQIAAEQFVGGVRGFRAEAAERRLGSDLEEGSFLDALGEQVEIVPDGGVALGVRDHGDYAGSAQAAEDIAQRLGREGVGQFDHQVVQIIDRIASRIAQRVVHVFVGNMKIAAEVEADAAVSGAG